MGTVLFPARRRFAKRRSEVLMRQLRFMKTRIAPKGALFEQPNEDFILFAIRDLPDTVAQARREKRIPRNADGLPDPGWITPIWNTLGGVYCQVPGVYREIFLRGVLGYLDALKDERCAQRHVRALHDPLLLGDIAVNRRTYWPGMAAEGTRLSRLMSPEDLFRQPPERVNTFWFCLAVMSKTEICHPSVRDAYYAEYADLVDDTLDFAAAVVYDAALVMHTARKVPLQQAIDAIALQHFERSLFGRIRKRVERAPWLRFT